MKWFIVRPTAAVELLYNAFSRKIKMNKHVELSQYLPEIFDFFLQNARKSIVFASIKNTLDYYVGLFRSPPICSKPCADGVVVIATSLFPEVLGSIPEGGKKGLYLS